MGDFHSVHMVCGFPFAAGSGIIAISGRETHADQTFREYPRPAPPARAHAGAAGRGAGHDAGGGV